MTLLTNLMRILPPPVTSVEAVSEQEWQSVEKVLGMELPDDYKAFISRYGAGAIDGFLWVLSPFAANRNLNLFDEGKAKLDALKRLRYESVPYPLYPDANGIIPWGVTDNGDVLYWICNGTPSHWTIVVNESRGPLWREYELSMSEFLEKLVSRDLVVDVFPDDFPSPVCKFIQGK